MGTDRFDKLGWWTAIGNPYNTDQASTSQYLALTIGTSSVHQDIFHWFQSGKVLLFSLEALQRGSSFIVQFNLSIFTLFDFRSLVDFIVGNYSASSLEQISLVFEGNSDFERFGWRTLLYVCIFVCAHI